MVCITAVPDGQDLGELDRLEMKICTAFVKLGSEFDLVVWLSSFCMLVGKVTEKLPDYCYAFIEFHKGYDADSSESRMSLEKRRSKIPRIPFTQPKSASPVSALQLRLSTFMLPRMSSFLTLPTMPLRFSKQSLECAVSDRKVNPKLLMPQRN